MALRPPRSRQWMDTGLWPDRRFPSFPAWVDASIQVCLLRFSKLLCNMKTKPQKPQRRTVRRLASQVRRRRLEMESLESRWLLAGDIVAWWPGDGNTDDIIGGNDGNLIGGATFGSGMVGQAFQFDGVDDYVDVPSYSEDVYAFEFWFKPDETVTASSASQGLAQFYEGGYFTGTDLSEGLLLGSTTSAVTGEVITLFETSATPGVVDYGRTAVTGITLESAQWVHLAANWNGAHYDIYLDGVQQSVTKGTSPHHTSLFSRADMVEIGRYRSEYFDGLIDEFTTYRQSLSAAEISAIYNSGAAGKDSTNTAPTSDAGGPYTVAEGSSIGVDGSGSSDPNNVITTYEWDFDYDGVSFDIDASGVAPTFDASTDAGPSTKTIALRVTDSGGFSDVATATITIDNVAPTIESLGVTTPKLDLIDSLTHWWSGDVDGSDLVGNSPGFLGNGVLAGVPGQVGGAFQFDGVDDYISLGNVPEFDFTQSDSFTFEAWVSRSAALRLKVPRPSLPRTTPAATRCNGLG